MTPQNPSSPLTYYLKSVENYLAATKLDHIAPLQGTITVQPLAQGEYNLNYLLQSETGKAVFRLNLGSQIDRADQILYEYKTLQLLQNSGLTPKPLMVDDSRTTIDRGVSIIEFLEGVHLNYQRDLLSAAGTFATIHQVEVPSHSNHLIKEEKPLSLIFKECRRLLETYFTSDLADPHLHKLLGKILAWANEARKGESFFQENPHHCIVNTEVNSGNFIVNRKQGKTYLIDWEMPRWGDPSTDLCHFYSPLTTLWKTDYELSEEEQAHFIEHYCKCIASPTLQQSLQKRLHLKYPFVLLRGISWSAMGWVMYQQNTAAIRNEDTWKKLNQYMDYHFIHNLFAPYLKA